MMPAAPPSSKLAPGFGDYLDLLRGLSATVVAFSHLELFGIVRDGAIPGLPHNAHMAVVVFFLLSGFLVASAAVRKPAGGLRGFALDRASRIFSVAVPVLALSFMAAAFGMITAEPAYQLRHAYFYMPLFLSSFNQSWVWKEIPLNLYPWWSLPFEVQYYAVFGCAYFLRGWRCVVITALLFVAMGPRLWLLFPVWLCGAALAAFVHIGITRSAARVLAAGAALALVAIPLLNVDTAIHYWTLIPWGYNGNARPFGNASYFLADYLTAPLILLHLYGMAHAGLQVPAGWRAPVRALAGVSFTLYLLHPLVYRIATDYFLLANQGAAVGLAMLALAIAAAFALAHVTEYRRASWRRFFDWLATRLFGSGHAQKI